MELYVGLKFRSKFFDSYHVEVLSIDKKSNIVIVNIIRSSKHHHTETWNYNHTIVEFTMGNWII